MASPAYQNNGVIIIWWDETEKGDDTNRTIPEIILSPLAKGNAYASPVEMNHSSDIKTMEEIFGLPFLNNPIPANETNAAGTGYNNIAIVNDLSDLFVSGAIPAAPSMSVIPGKITFDSISGDYFQPVHIANNGSSAVAAPLWLILDNLSPNATLVNGDGATAVLAPLGSPFIGVPVGDDSILRPHETKTVVLEFSNPSAAAITYSTRVFDVIPTP